MTRSSTLGYLPGLDGLRGLAVGAVFLFHAGALQGGFLGVDVFFVISGFLITGLAISEIEATGSFRLGHFWARRAKRLLPAIFALAAAMVIWSQIDVGSHRTPPRDVVATLGYVANWVRVGDGYEYFAAYSSPSLLEHTWSLAVEEQFYVIWPLIIVGAFACARRFDWSPRWTIAGVAGIAAVTSTAWSWWLASGSESSADLNRLFFGTDTRAVGLAAGCIAGCVFTSGATTGNRKAGAVQTVAAAGAAALLVVMMLTNNGSERLLYGPGFAIVAMASVLLIVTASAEGPVRALLSLQPLTILGRVSYGVYLWHWPVIVILTEERLGVSGLRLGAVWVVATAVPVAVSWWFIEKRAPLPRREQPLTAAAYTAAGVVVAVAAVALIPSHAALPTAEDVALPSTASSSSFTVQGGELPAPTDRPLRVLVIGDSIPESLSEPFPNPVVLDAQLQVEVTNRSVIACPVTWQGTWAFDNGQLVGDPGFCDGEDRFAAAVATENPDVILFFFGWGGTIAGRELPDGRIIAACDAEFDTAYADELEVLADRFGDEASVVVSTVARPTEFRDSAQSGRPDCMNDELRTRDLALFDFDEFLCPGRDCELAKPLLRDTVHFIDAPAIRDLVWPEILRQTLQAAGYAS